MDESNMSDTSNNPKLTINRTFNAPRALVWQAFSKADYLSQWWGPKGLTTQVKRFKFQPEGVFHYGLKGPDGSIMWGIFVYKDIKKPTKIVFTNAFSNEKGETVKAPEVPFGKHWPLEILNTITFDEQGEKTLMKMVSYPLVASAEVLETFGNNIGNMEMGFESTFDQLESVLGTLK